MDANAYSTKAFRARNQRWELRDSHIQILVSSPHDQTSVLLDAIAAEWKPLANGKLGKVGSADEGTRHAAMLTSGVILEPPCPPDEGRQMT